MQIGLRILSSFFILFCFYAEAQEAALGPIRIESSETENFVTTTIINEKDIQTKNSANVADLLRDIPGLEVIRQGGLGQTTSLFIRGARSEDCLVLIDGIEVNDLLSPSGGFDFSSMMTTNIERIEIFRGPQSVRFGAGAMGGVINIITRNGIGLSETNYQIEAGTYQTQRAGVNTRLGNETLGLSLGLESFQTQGFSAASGGVTEEADGAEIQSGSMKLSWIPQSTSAVDATLRYSDSKSDLDQMGGASGDDPNNVSRTKQLVTGVVGAEYFWQRKLKLGLGAFFSEVERQSVNSPDLLSLTDSRDHFLSESRKIQSENEWSIDAAQKIKLNIQWREESGYLQSIYNGSESNIERKKQFVWGTSANYFFESDTWFADFGLRTDQSSIVGAITRAAA